MKYDNYSIILEKKLEKNIEEIIQIFKNSTQLNMDSKIRRSAYLRAICVNALNKKFSKITQDFYVKNIKSNYSFPSYEMYLLAKIFVKNLTLKQILKFQKIKFIFNFLKGFLKIIYWFLTIILNSLNKKIKKLKIIFFL